MSALAVVVASSSLSAVLPRVFDVARHLALLRHLKLRPLRHAAIAYGYVGYCGDRVLIRFREYFHCQSIFSNFKSRLIAWHFTKIQRTCTRLVNWDSRLSSLSVNCRIANLVHCSIYVAGLCRLLHITRRTWRASITPLYCSDHY